MFIDTFDTNNTSLHPQVCENILNDNIFRLFLIKIFNENPSILEIPSYIKEHKA